MSRCKGLGKSHEDDLQSKLWRALGHGDHGSDGFISLANSQYLARP